MKLGHVTEGPRGYRRTHVTGSEKKAASVSSSPLLPSSCGCILKWETIKKKQVSKYSVPLVIFLNIILFVFHFLFNLSVCVSPPLLPLCSVKFKHPSLARLSLLCCQSNKIHNNLGLCVCVYVCWVCVHVFPISHGHPYQTLSQNPPLTHLK